MTLDVEKLDVVADRGYFSSEQILACDKADITVTLPKPRFARGGLYGACARRS